MGSGTSTSATWSSGSPVADQRPLQYQARRWPGSSVSHVKAPQRRRRSRGRSTQVSAHHGSGVGLVAGLVGGRARAPCGQTRQPCSGTSASTGSTPSATEVAASSDAAATRPTGRRFGRHPGRDRRSRGRRHLPPRRRRRRRAASGRAGRRRARPLRAGLGHRRGRGHRHHERPGGVHRRPHQAHRRPAAAARHQPVFAALDASSRRCGSAPTMPELPEVQAHAERLTAEFGGAVLATFTPLAFHALKTAMPSPDEADGLAARRGRPAGQVPAARLRRRHLRRAPDAGRPAEARPEADGPAEARPGPLDVRRRAGPAAHRAGTERRAGVWVLGHRRACSTGRRSTTSVPRRPTSRPRSWPSCFAARRDAAPHVPARPGLPSPGSDGGWPTRSATGPSCRRSSSTKKLGLDGAAQVVAAIHEAVDEGLAYERTRPDMSARPIGPAACTTAPASRARCAATRCARWPTRSTQVNYCPTCQTGGKVLADNTTSKFLK